MKDTLQLFMWGYQPHYRSALESLTKRTFEAIGFDAEAKAVLIGVRKPGSAEPNPVCIEPEFETWPLSLFDGIREEIEVEYPKHDLQNMFYGHQRSMEEKPENQRRDVVRTAVLRRLKAFDAEHAVQSFGGWPRLVGDYYIVPVLQIPQAALDRVPSLKTDVLYLGRYRPSKSFLHTCIGELLTIATDELERDDPGHRDFGRDPSTDEITRSAADHFLRTPLLATARERKPEEAYALRLFKSLNEVSSHMYENAAGIGRLLIVNPDDPGVEYSLRFPDAIPFRDTRWVRKLLQMSVGANALIANGRGIWGLGSLRHHDPKSETAFWVDFIGHYQWNLRLDDKMLLQSRFGEPTLGTEVISDERFIDNYRRILPGTTDVQARNGLRILQAMMKEPKGCMVVFASDAKEEAARLAQQGMSVVPVQLDNKLLTSASRIDGSILCDPDGVCYAMGVILDGLANDNCMPSRGSRFNSAIRYVFNADAPRLAMVKSDDGVLDVIPLLLPRIPRQEFLDAIAALERATLDNYHKPRLYLDNHRFYALPEDVPRINAALDRIDAMPLEVGMIRLGTTRFTVHPAMDPEYFT